MPNGQELVGFQRCRYPPLAVPIRFEQSRQLRGFTSAA